MENEWHKFFDFIRLLSFSAILYVLVALKYDFPGEWRKMKIPMLAISSLIFLSSSWVLYTKYVGVDIVYNGGGIGKPIGFLWLFVFILLFALVYPKSKLKKGNKHVIS